jgi:hypothetical protein
MRASSLRFSKVALIVPRECHQQHCAHQRAQAQQHWRKPRVWRRLDHRHRLCRHNDTQVDTIAALCVDTMHALLQPSSGHSKQLSAPSAHEFSGQLNEQVVQAI